MKKNVSRLFAVTFLTLNRMVLNNFPCVVLNPVRRTKAVQPLLLAIQRERGGISQLKLKK